MSICDFDVIWVQLFNALVQMLLCPEVVNGPFYDSATNYNIITIEHKYTNCIPLLNYGHFN